VDTLSPGVLLLFVEVMEVFLEDNGAFITAVVCVVRVFTFLACDGLSFSEESEESSDAEESEDARVLRLRTLLRVAAVGFIAAVVGLVAVAFKCDGGRGLASFSSSA